MELLQIENLLKNGQYEQIYQQMETSQELEGCRQEEHLRPNPHDARRLKKMSSIEMICFLILTAETIVKIYKYSGIALLADKVRRGRSSGPCWKSLQHGGVHHQVDSSEKTDSQRRQFRPVSKPNAAAAGSHGGRK